MHLLCQVLHCGMSPSTQCKANRNAGLRTLHCWQPVTCTMTPSPAEYWLSTLHISVTASSKPSSMTFLLISCGPLHMRLRHGGLLAATSQKGVTEQVAGKLRYRLQAGRLQRRSRQVVAATLAE